MPTTQTPAKRTTRSKAPAKRTTRSKAPAEKLQHPELPDSGHPLWYIAWFLRKTTEKAKLEAARRAEYKKRNEDRILTLALTCAISNLDIEVLNTAKDIVRNGLLPFAWVGTTALQHHQASAQGGAA